MFHLKYLLASDTHILNFSIHFILALLDILNLKFQFFALDLVKPTDQPPLSHNFRAHQNNLNKVENDIAKSFLEFDLLLLKLHIHLKISQDYSEFDLLKSVNYQDCNHFQIYCQELNNILYKVHLLFEHLHLLVMIVSPQNFSLKSFIRLGIHWESCNLLLIEVMFEEHHL